MKILLTGATGLVGQHLGPILVEEGHEVFVVTRDAERARAQLNFPCQIIEGDLMKEGLRQPLMNEIEALIHLAGETVMGPWTDEKKSRIYDSRVLSSQNLVSSLADNKKLRVVISASGVGYYGSRGDEILDEKSHPGSDFLAHVCVDWERVWEKASAKNQLNGARVVLLRLGLVLSAQGGALAKMQGPFQWGFGAQLGSGQQWMSWIHIKDLMRIILWTLSESFKDKNHLSAVVEGVMTAPYESTVGVYNAVAPVPLINKDFSRILAAQFRRPMFLKVPAFVLRSVLGEASEMLLGSQRAEPQRLHRSGFNFDFQLLGDALKDIYDGQNVN